MQLNLSKIIVFTSVALAFSAGTIINSSFLVKATELQTEDSSLVKGDNKVKKYKATVSASMPSMNRVANPATLYDTKEIAQLVDESQTVLNDLYRADSKYGDGSSAYMILFEQYTGGVGNDPARVAKGTLHDGKCIGYIKNFKKKIQNPLLPQEVKDRLNYEITKMEQALSWAKDYKDGLYPPIPKWAAQWSEELGGSSKKKKK